MIQIRLDLVEALWVEGALDDADADLSFGDGDDGCPALSSDAVER